MHTKFLRKFIYFQKISFLLEFHFKLNQLYIYMERSTKKPIEVIPYFIQASPLEIYAHGQIRFSPKSITIVTNIVRFQC